MKPVFRVRLADPSYVVKVLNNETKEFMDVYPGLTMHNDIIGIFSFKSTVSGASLMTFGATSIKRFSIVFAMFYRNAWRIRLRLVVTQKNGIIGLPLTKIIYSDHGKIEIPMEYRKNTALMVRIFSKYQDISIDLRVFAPRWSIQRILWPD